VTPGLSSRLAAIVEALPVRPDSRVLEIGCGSGAAARAVADRLVGGHVLAIDRSGKAVAQATAAGAAHIAAGRLRTRHVAAEDFVLQPGDEPFDLVLAVRVGALDGRHPALGQRVMQRIAAATTPGARLFVDGGHPLRELPIAGPVPGDREAEVGPRSPSG
jgi:cyclopropane fatty-acyl-phospholipid synthase-like methyltransferase